LHGIPRTGAVSPSCEEGFPVGSTRLSLEPSGQDASTGTLFLQLVPPLPLALAGGSWAIIIVALILFAGLVIGYFTYRGSGIRDHPRGPERDDAAPGAAGQSEVSGKDAGQSPGERGTR
jgi:hypothetical protein